MRAPALLRLGAHLAPKNEEPNSRGENHHNINYGLFTSLVTMNLTPLYSGAFYS